MSETTGLNIEAPTNWLDDRLGIARSSRKLINKIFPDHWSFMIGEIALYSFIILVLTGIFLTLYYVPSMATVVYHGPYKSLDGQRVTEAYASTVNISFSVRFGILMRQMHHWAADVFIAAICVHMVRIFFTGAFRRPREINWMIGVTLLILAIFNGFLGYSLPDDLVSGTGIRIAFSILESIPFVGAPLAYFLFGGNYPGTEIIPRFFIIHVLILPGIIIGLLAAHLGIMVRQKHTQYPGHGATEHNVVGSVMWPTYAFKTLGYFLLTAAVLAGMGGLFQINPIWQFGPYLPWHVSYAVQPDWYMGWLDGALRIMPAWETVFPGGHMIPNVFYPGVLFPGITFGLFYSWPFIEDKFTKESRVEHHILDRPRDRPLRTAIGAGVLSFYCVLFGASSTDVFANYFGLSLNKVLWGFRISVVVVPIIVGFVAHRICIELQTWEGAGERHRSGVVVRSADGSYSLVESAPRPGDEEPERQAIPVPEEVLAASPLAHELVLAGASEVDGDGEDGRGILQAPREPRPDFRERSSFVPPFFRRNR
jgi:ubiquinol-cytochrome c reductase cytochrome b subunit